MAISWKRWIFLAWLFLIPASGKTVPPMMAANDNDSLFLNKDGSVWGAGNVANRWPGATSPVRVFNAPNITSIATAGGTNIALLADGTVQVVGWNGSGLLGNGTNSGYADSPVLVPGLTAVRAIASSPNHVLALRQDGTVWSWGKNGFGQLGDGTQNDRFLPGQVIGLSRIVSVAASSSNSLALDADGVVWSWGINFGGAAGDGTEGISNTSDPNYYKLTPVRVRNLDQVIAIASGYGTNHALRADGTVWSWGDGFDGKNGDGQPSGHQTLPVPVSGLTSVVAISVTADHSLALKSDGTVWAWGNNNLGQLGSSTVTSSAVPVQIPGLSDIAAIAAGGAHSLAMHRDGAVYAWGMNGNAQLGDGTVTSRPAPRAVLGPGGAGQLNLIQPAPANPNQLPRVSIALQQNLGTAPFTVNATATDAYDPDGAVVDYQWLTSDGRQATGASATFTFNSPGAYDIDLFAVDDRGGRGFSQQQIFVTPAASAALPVLPRVAAGSDRSMALSVDGRVSAWGSKWFLGIVDQSVLDGLPEANPVPIATGLSGVTDITSGDLAAYAVLADGSLLSWGINDHGELGVRSQIRFTSGPLMVSGLPPVRQLAAVRHVLALTQQGQVYGWGSNWAGQLGLGDTVNRFQPSPIAGLTDVVAVAAGWDFSLALKSDGTVWAWGSNADNQLADGTVISRYLPTQVPGLTNITKIIATRNPWFAISADGSVWGVNVPFGWAFPGSTLAFGSRWRIPSLDGFVSFAGQWNYALGLKADGTIWTWGYRSSGMLGIAGTEDIGSPQQIAGVTEVSGIVSGETGPAAWRRDGAVVTWGANVYGQLGDGTLAARTYPVLVVNPTLDGPYDLAPDVSNSIPRNLVPPFFLVTHKFGGLDATSLYTDLRGPTAGGSFASVNGVGKFTAGYNVYVAAAVPSGAVPLYFQLDSNNNWGSLRWPMADFMRGVALDSQTATVRAQILQNANLTGLAGAEIIVGYGTDPDEMLRNARYRTIFTVPAQ